MKRPLQPSNKVHFESIGIFNHVSIDCTTMSASIRKQEIDQSELTKDLVWLSKAKAQAILLHELLVLLRPLSSHLESLSATLRAFINWEWVDVGSSWWWSSTNFGKEFKVGSVHLV
jgi:hypothetical protein